MTARNGGFRRGQWPSFADQPYINNYRVYDDRVGETTRFTHRADHEWYWLPQQQPHEVSMLKCYDSVTDGSVSRCGPRPSPRTAPRGGRRGVSRRRRRAAPRRRWSFHTACIDPSLPRDAPCRKNLVVRAFVFFDE